VPKVIDKYIGLAQETVTHRKVLEGSAPVLLIKERSEKAELLQCPKAGITVQPLILI